MENKLFVTVSHPIRSVEREGLRPPCSHCRYDMPFFRNFDGSFSTRFSMEFFILTFKFLYHFNFDSFLKDF